ncbi:MAG: CHAT domain-containing tetratricopeptide repeat protein [Cyclobacteriaceae bacterium]
MFIISAFISCFEVYSQAPDPESLLAEGKRLHFDAKYDSAIGVFQRAKNVFESRKNDKQLVETQYAIAESMSNLGRCDEANEMASNALTLCLAKFGETDALTADGYYQLSRVQGGCLGLQEEAISSVSKSIALKRSIYGERSDDIAFDFTMMGYFYTSLGNYDSAEHYLTKAFDIRSQSVSTDSVEFSHTLYYLARIKERKGDMRMALKLSTQALGIRQSLLVKDHPTTSNSLNDIGIIYKTMGNFDQALNYYIPALEIRKRTLGKDHVNVGASYYTIGNLYGNSYDYRRAIHFIEQGNAIILNRFGEKAPVLHTYYAYLGKMYSYVGEIEEAKRLLLLAERLAEKYLREGHPYRAIIYDLMGEFYADREDILLQIDYLKKAQRIYREEHGEETMREASVLVKLGEANFKLSNPSLARDYYDRALRIYTQRLGTKNVGIGGLYQKLGDVSSDRGELEDALNYYTKSLEAISSDTLVAGFPRDLNSIMHKQSALHSYQKIAEVYHRLYRKSNELKYLKESLAKNQFAVKLLDNILSNFDLETSKTQLEKDSRGLLEQALETAYELYSLTKEDEYKHIAFEIMEKSKSPILLSRVKENEAKVLNGIPDSLLNLERDIRIELSYYRGQLRNAKMEDNFELITVNQKEVFETQNAFEDLKTQLKELYPDYYSYNYEEHVVDLEEVRKFLPGETAVIEYFESASAIYAFLLSGEDFEITKYAVSDDFTQILEDYQKSLTDNNFIVLQPQKADSLFAHSASFLFDALVGPALEQLSVEARQLIVVPDGRLTQINFNTFLTEQPNFEEINYSDLSYLLNDYAISYAYSSTLNFRDFSAPSSFSFAGFAPSYKDDEYASLDSASHPLAYQLVRSGKLALPGAISEVSVISEYLNGTSWINENASESNFKSNTNKYSVLHLAMHSLINSEEPEYSELLFNAEKDSLDDGYLTIDEIYNLDLNADMVVLSACSSGSGRIQVGEGPISFTRAFSYAGCPSVVMSMWEIPDAATTGIMVEFYKNIKSGDTKDQALRKAQLFYLNNTSDPLYQHPFFWGSFVAMGNTEAIGGTSQNRKILALVISAVVLIGFFRVRRRISANFS